MKNELNGAGVDRRSFLKRTAAVGVAAPVVATFAMPNAAQAASTDAAPTIESAGCSAALVVVTGTGIPGAVVNVYEASSCAGTPDTTAVVDLNGDWTASYPDTGGTDVSANQDTTGLGADPGSCTTIAVDRSACV